MGRQQFRMLASFVLIAVTSGCSKEYPRAVLATPEPVQGRVTFGDGTPVRGGIIFFAPLDADAEGQIRFEAASLIDESGRYKLGFNGDGLGAAVGDYKVTILPRDYQELPGSNTSRIPAMYREKETTPLAAAVKQGPNTIDFVLK